MQFANLLVFFVLHMAVVSDDSSIPPEAIKAWEDYRAQAVDLCGSRTGKVMVNGMLRNTNKESYKKGVNNSIMYSLQSASPSSKYADDIYVVNSVYGFQLARNMSNGKLIPSDIRRLDDVGYLITPLKIDPRKSSRDYLENLVCMLPLSGYNMLDVTKLYSIKSGIIKRDAGKVKYEAELEYIGKAPDSRRLARPLLRICVVLNADHYWRIEKYSYDRELNDRIIESSSGIIAYKALASKLVVPISIRHSISYSNDAKMKIEHVIDYALHEERPSPEADFLLTAFGMPEPRWLPGANTSSVPLHIIVSIAGIACLILACCILYRRNKAMS